MKNTLIEHKTPRGPQLLEKVRMKWIIDFVEDQGIIRVKTSGLMSFDDKKKLFEEMFTAGRSRKINAFFIDQKETCFGLSVLEIDRLPELFRNIGFEVKDKVAILTNSDSSTKPLFAFLQDIFALRSLRVCVFTDSQEAIAWLRRKF
jgi:hypothetical protein